MELAAIIDLQRHPIDQPAYRASCREMLDNGGAMVLDDFLLPDAVTRVREEGLAEQNGAYFCTQSHNVYLTPPDDAYPMEHPRNREVVSSKGLIADDQIPAGSPLRQLYHSHLFQDFLKEVLGEEALYPYADPLSSINLHYAGRGQELGWHFDNSSFAITLMIQPTEAGGDFEYVADVRDADSGEMNFEKVGSVLDGNVPVKRMNLSAGSLALFRGRNSIHRVSPNEGDRTRMLVVLAYNSAPGISLSESARMTFFGRLQ